MLLMVPSLDGVSVPFVAPLVYVLPVGYEHLEALVRLEMVVLRMAGLESLLNVLQEMDGLSTVQVVHHEEADLWVVGLLGALELVFLAYQVSGYFVYHLEAPHGVGL